MRIWFQDPLVLLLLAALPPLIHLSLRRRAAMSRKRRTAFLTLRASAFLFLVLAAAGPRFSRASQGISVLFLLDDSVSVGEPQRREALEAIAGIRSRLGPEDHAGLVRFAASASYEDLPEGAEADASPPADAEATDIEGALRTAAASFPPSGARRLVLLSDGRENRGRAEDAVAFLRSARIAAFAVPLEPPSGGEASLESLAAPAVLRSGEPHTVTAVVRARSASRARVTLLRDGALFGTMDAALRPGRNVFSFASELQGTGLHEYEAVLDPAVDTVRENNRFRALVEVRGPPRVLYVHKKGARSPAFTAALGTQGFLVEECGPEGIPATLRGLSAYDAVVLDNVPSFSLSFQAMETLESYVRDTGGGLLMSGGDTSFGAGGWYGTPLERALPVEMDAASPARLPRLSLVIVTDKSGSMGGQVSGGETKLDVVKSAAVATLDLLNPFDRVGVLAFDADHEWAVPLTDAADRDVIATDLARLQSGGGTDMAPALEEAHAVLAGAASALKHIIVLTDGLTQEADHEGIVRRIAADGITVSAVAVGEDADRELLARIAEIGGGRYYAASDPRTVPRIFVTETIIARRGLLMEKRFLPQPASGSEILSGIPLSSFPPLDGFVLTYPKKASEQVLTGLQDAPLLSVWRYGLGKSAAFTSDWGARWARDWVEWESFPRFVAHLVRWVERTGGPDILVPAVRIESGQGRITVDAVDGGTFVDGLDMGGTVLAPSGAATPLSLRQTAPGRYEGRFDAEETGDYVVTLIAAPGAAHDAAPGAAVSSRVLGISVPYAEEYRDVGADTALLSRLSRDTGGRILDADDEEGLSELLRRGKAESAEATGLESLIPLTVALVLFFLDVCARQLRIPAGLRSLFARLRGRMRPASAVRYEDVKAAVEAKREEERRRLRERITVGSSSRKYGSELAAHLYMARLAARRDAASGALRAGAASDAASDAVKRPAEDGGAGGG